MSDMIRFSGRCEIEAAIGDLKPTRLSILAYSGDVMTVDGFGAVVVSLDGMELPGSIPILSDHDNRLASVVASGTPRIQRSTLGIMATLADSDGFQTFRSYIMLDPVISDLAKAADAIDLAIRHLARAERRGIAPAASVACFAVLAMEQMNKRIMNACEEVSNRPSENERAAS